MSESNDRIVEWLLDDSAETRNPIRERLSLEEVLDEGDEAQRQQAQQLLDSLPG